MRLGSVERTVGHGGLIDETALRSLQEVLSEVGQLTGEGDLRLVVTATDYLCLSHSFVGHISKANSGFAMGYGCDHPKKNESIGSVALSRHHLPSPVSLTDILASTRAENTSASDCGQKDMRKSNI